MTIPGRTTWHDWADLIGYPCTAHEFRQSVGPLAATTAELDALLWHGAEPEHCPRHAITVLGHPVVEIPHWPEWMP